ncbi:hypothetical protein FDECE_13448 [Fusarium decemcellulare]|nr:hypothetical protein FDECE_13448 [Fusarium decemcellulare]
MPSVITKSAGVEILASPATVRAVFLDFARYQQWHPGWNLGPVDSAIKPVDLKAGDKMRVSLHGMTFHPVVIENTPRCFTWEGSVPFIASGKHFFRFTPSTENPGATSFVQGEDYSGLLVTMFGSWIKTDEPNQNFDMFNAALKKEAERITHGGQ